MLQDLAKVVAPEAEKVGACCPAEAAAPQAALPAGARRGIGGAVRSYLLRFGH